MKCNDALLMEKVPPVAKEQRLAVAGVMSGSNPNLPVLQGWRPYRRNHIQNVDICRTKYK